MSRTLVPVSDLSASNWSASTGATLFGVLDDGATTNSSDYITGYGGTSYAQLGFTPATRSSGVITFTLDLQTQAAAQTGSLSMSALNGTTVLSTRSISPVATYTAIVFQTNSSSITDWSNISFAFQQNSTANVNIYNIYSTIGDYVPYRYQRSLPAEQVIKDFYGYGNDKTASDAIAAYLGLEGYYHGQYTLEQLFMILHFENPDKLAAESDPIAAYINTRASLKLPDFTQYDGKAYDRQYLLNAEFYNRKDDPNQSFTQVALPTVARYGFTRTQNGLSASNGDFLYTNASLNSAWKDGGTSFHVGYSAGIFATGVVESFVGNALTQMYQFDVKPYLASTAYTGKNTLFEIPNYLRIDFSGSGYNRFIAVLHDGSTYSSSIPAPATTFAAGESVRFEFLYGIPELMCKFIVNGVHDDMVQDENFNGNTIGAAFYLGTNATAGTPFSGAFNEFRMSDSLKVFG